MRFVPLLFMLILTACIAAAPGKTDKPSGGSEDPITGGAITVTTLDAVTPGQKGVPRPKPNPALTAPNPDATEPASDSDVPDPAAKPPVTEPGATAPVAPARAVSAAEKTCIRQGGTWGPAGKAGETCTKQTKDNGKQCNAESDCEGYCLARSKTCAPFTPMFGCNEILQDNGVQVTLCLD